MEKKRNKKKDKKPNENTVLVVQTEPTVVLQLADEGVSLAGPTDYCNWIIPQRFLMGAYPKRTTDIISLLESGVTTFVNLVHGQEMEQLSKYGSYFDFAKNELLKNKTKYKQKPSDLKYIHIPIYDKQIAEDEVVRKLVNDIEKWLKSGEIVFIHCRGGHGRTGTIVSVFLGMVFSIDSWSALELAQKIHDHRIQVKKQPGRYTCPETHQQKSQVYKLLDQLNL